MPRLDGIDISNYTASIDMSKVAQNYDFVIIKATEGSGSELNNPHFAGPARNDWAAARAAGITRGAYHIFYHRPGSSTPEDQAQHFLTVMSDFKNGDLAPAIDFEPTSFAGLNDAASGERAVLKWLSIVEMALTARTGKTIKPLIYTNLTIINDDLGNPDSLAGYPLYLAQYRSSMTAPDPWDNQDIAIWQYAENESVQDVVDDCDYCQFGTLTSGSKGKTVKMVQQWLVGAGLLPAGSVDGKYGPGTASAVKAFQTNSGLTSDGIVGMNTWVALQWS